MNLPFEFVAIATLDEIADLRARHLDTLLEAQELLLEVWIAESRAFLVVAHGAKCGYFIVHPARGLLEFHLEQPYWIFADAVLRGIVERGLAQRAWVKSFDHLFLSASLGLQPEVRVAGLLVRDYQPRPLPALDRIRFTARPATFADMPRIERLDQEVFTDHERLRRLVADERMTLFENDEGLVGFGILQPVIPGRPDVDIGLAVAGKFRRRGYAVYIFRWLVEHCLERGLRPIAGCAAENTPSRTMGERIGMSARYRLLELAYRRPDT